MGRRNVLEVMARLRSHTTIFYSTHILEDVQRVSDTVAILNEGKLIAIAPIGELLAGTGHTTFVVELAGTAEAARRRMPACSERSWRTTRSRSANSDGVAISSRTCS